MISIYLVIICESSCCAQTNLDLLMGIGDFDICTRSKVSGLADLGIEPSENLSVANGWTAAIDYQYKDSYIFRLVNSTNFTGNGAAYLVSNTSYQYCGINNTSGKTLLAQLYTYIESNTNAPIVTFQSGDEFVFHIDRIISSNFSSPKPAVAIGMFYKVSGSSTQLYKSTSVDLSSGHADNISFSLKESGVTFVRPYIEISVANNSPANKTPGILLSGAKLWIRRSGETDFITQEDPITTYRNIDTAFCGWDTSNTPVRLAAEISDEVIGHAQSYVQMTQLRKLNPNIKVYLYQSGTTACYTDLDSFWSLSPFRVQDVADSNPSWLWPQSNPKAANDPDTFSNISPSSTWGQLISTYLNGSGYPDRFWISKITDSNYQNKWANSVIDKAKKIGADGVFIDDCGVLNGSVDRDGVWRYTWEVQQFLHAVVPKLRAAGLTTVVNNALGLLDGSETWCGIAEVYFNPLWQPTTSLSESAGYSANTPANTPDIFFRESSFIMNDYVYNSDYWLKCINDAKIIKEWNSQLTDQFKKRIHYYISLQNTDEHPAYDKSGKSGWMTFCLASYLLCYNQYTSFAPAIRSASGVDDPDIDLSITKKLGIPDGDDSSVDNSPYFRMRKYKAGDSSALGGIVIVNANKSINKKYTVNFDATDESGNKITPGTAITLKPNSGKILLNRNVISLQLYTPEQNVISNQVLNITLTYWNTGTSTVSSVLISAYVPENTKYVVGSAERSGGKYNAITNTVSWVVQQLAAGVSGAKTFKVVVD